MARYEVTPATNAAGDTVYCVFDHRDQQLRAREFRTEAAAWDNAQRLEMLARERHFQHPTR